VSLIENLQLLDALLHLSNQTPISAAPLKTPNFHSASYKMAVVYRALVATNDIDASDTSNMSNKPMACAKAQEEAQEEAE